MPVSNWWVVDDALMRIMGGPYLWDGGSEWSPPPGQRAVNADPSAQGYAWASAPVAPATLAELASRVVALEQLLAGQARGVRTWQTTGLFALGATSTERVTLKTAMPSNAYTATALITGPLARSFAVQSATVVDKQSVDVTIKADVLSTLTTNSLKALVFTD